MFEQVSNARKCAQLRFARDPARRVFDKTQLKTHERTWNANSMKVAMSQLSPNVHLCGVVQSHSVLCTVPLVACLGASPTASPMQTSEQACVQTQRANPPHSHKRANNRGHCAQKHRSAFI